MKPKIPKLTNSEEEVLELLWKVQKPLTASEIVELSADKTWKPSYIHLLINSLLKKELIRVSGFSRTTKNYARTFEPTRTKEELLAIRLKQRPDFSSGSIRNLFAALVEEETDESLIDELSDLLRKRKQELSEEQQERRSP